MMVKTVSSMRRKRREKEFVKQKQMVWNSPIHIDRQTVNQTTPSRSSAAGRNLFQTISWSLVKKIDIKMLSKKTFKCDPLCAKYRLAETLRISLLIMLDKAWLPKTHQLHGYLESFIWWENTKNFPWILTQAIEENVKQLKVGFVWL